MGFGFGIYWAHVLPYFLYIAGIAVVVITIFKVEWGILFLIPILPLQTTLDSMQQMPMGKDIVDILLIAMVIGWVVKAFNRKNFLDSSALNGPLIFLIIYTLFSLYQGFNHLGYYAAFDMYDPRVQTWKNYAILPLIYFIVFNNIRDKKYIRWLVWLMIGVIFIMSLQFFREYRWIDKTMFRQDKRWSGTFAWLGANEYAAFYSNYMFIILGLFLFVKSKLKKAFLLLTMGLNAYCIFFLFSRGAYLASYVILTLAGILRKHALILLTVLSVLVFWHTLLPPAMVERIEMTKDANGQYETSAQLRINMWEESMRLFVSSPLIGIGFNTISYLGKELDLSLGDTHNIYVKILAEQGIVGIIIFFSIIFLAAGYSWKLYHQARDNFFKGLGFGFLMCIFSLLISNFFGDRWTYLPLTAYFFAFMALVNRAYLITEHERAQATKAEKAKRIQKKK